MSYFRGERPLNFSIPRAVNLSVLTFSLIPLDENKLSPSLIADGLSIYSEKS